MLTTSAVVCMYFLFVLCMLVNESLVDQPLAEGTFPVQINLFPIYLKRREGGC